MWKKEFNLFVMLSCAFGLAWALTGEASAVEAMRVSATAAEMYPRRYGKAAEAAGGPFNRGRIPAHPDVVNPVPGQDRGNSSAAGNPGAREAVPPTKVMLFFDTEDYTCDRANDPIRDIAHILTAEGVRGNFNIVGYLALRLVELRRFDVIDALKPHVLGTQTLYHTRHPDIAELGDDPDYARSYRRTMIDEARGIGMIEAVLGEDRCLFACPPGNSLSPAAFDAYSDMGIIINAGTGFYGTKKADGSYWRQMLMRSDGKALGLWYFNQIHVPYYQGFGIQNDLMPGSDEKYRNLPKTLDDLARWDFVALYMHPMMSVKTQYWDAINYRGGNNVEWRKWKPAPDRDPAARRPSARSAGLAEVGHWPGNRLDISHKRRYGNERNQGRSGRLRLHGHDALGSLQGYEGREGCRACGCRCG